MKNKVVTIIVKKTFRRCIDIRDYVVEKLIREKSYCKVVYKDDYMLLTPDQLANNQVAVSKEFESSFPEGGHKTYKLISYKWVPVTKEELKERRVLKNSIQTPDDTVLISRHRHDYVSHVDKNSEMYAVDGGTEYLRRVYDKHDFKELSVYDDGTHETRRNNLFWGRNYDKDMNKLPETEYILIKDLDTDHIKAILDAQFQISDFYKEVFEEELKQREQVKA